MRLGGASALAFMTATLAAQTGSNPDALYTRVHQRVIDNVARLPNYTCVQTITRSVYGTASPSKHASQCDEIVRNREAHTPPLVDWDRLRIDVAIGDKHEVYAWVGAARFEEGDLSKLVGGGQTSMGDFGSMILSIFENHTAMHLEGERKIGARRLLEYSYDTPLESSQYRVRVGPEQFLTAYRGSVFLDPEIAEVVRVTARSAVLPEQTGYCQVSKELDYTQLRAGSGAVMIPRETTSRAVDRDGIEMVSVSDYSSCREYVGESVLRFDDPSAESTAQPGDADAAAKNVSAGGPPRAIPPNLELDCRITTTIDSDTAAAGDRIEAVLRAPLKDSSGNVLAPAGTPVHGRLMTFARHPGSAGRKESYEIGVQLRSIDLGGARVPFAAALVNGIQNKGASVRLTLHPGIGSFIFYDKKVHLTNLDSKWVTTSPAAGQNATR
jgi:hypothetical protein